MYRKCQCLPKWQVHHETISPQQTMARGQRDSFRSWTELQISIYFWCREVFQEVCVCVFGRCTVCVRGWGGLVGWAVGRSGRGEREDCRGVVTWVAPLQLGERERQAEETRLRGDGTGAQLHFPFCRISTVASFFSVSFHSTEWVKERERAIEREWKRKSSQFFFKDSILAFLQTDVACHLVVKQAHRSYNTEVLLTCFLLFMVLL